MLNSDRLVFNSKADSIIFNSQKTISLTSIQSVGLYSQDGDVTLQSGKGNVRLGDVNANQSVVLGDNFMKDFSDLIKKLQTLCSTLSKEPKIYISGPAATSAQNQISQMLNNINNYTSKIVKTL